MYLNSETSHLTRQPGSCIWPVSYPSILHVVPLRVDKLSFSKHRDPRLLYLFQKHCVFHFFVYTFHHLGLAAGAGRVGNVPFLSSYAWKRELHILVRS